MLAPTSVEFRNDINVKKFEVPDDGSKLVCACTDHFVLMREIPWLEMQALVRAYADEHDAAVLKFFLQPSSDVKKPGSAHMSRPLKIANQASPEALLIGRINAGKSTISGTYCSTSAIQAAVSANGLLKGYQQRERTIEPAWHIVNEPYVVQRKVAITMIASDIRTMGWAQKLSGLYLVASLRVLELVEASNSSEEFLNRVCGPLVQWFLDPIRKGAHGVNTSGTRRPLTLVWFAMWLAERNVLLFPTTVMRRGSELLPRRYRHFVETWIRPIELRAVGEETLRRVESISRKGGRERASLLIITYNLIAPGLAYGRVAAGSIKYLKDLVKHQVEEVILSAVWKIEAARLKSGSLDAHQLQTQADLVIQSAPAKLNQGAVLWDWVDDRSAPISPYARYVRSNFDVGPNLQSHVDELRRIFPAVAGKSATAVNNHIAVWLFFLSSLEDDKVPAHPADISPKLLAALHEKDSVNNLLSFMVLHQVPRMMQRATLSTLKRVWKIAAIDVGNDDLLCPVSNQLISISRRGSDSRPSSTTRRAVDMEILDLLIEENRARDFAFSRERVHSFTGHPLDYRLVACPESGELISVWWPGLAVLMDVMLQIPLRNKQGRFLDSGEGDEFTLDLATLQLQPNTRATAERGRNQGLIQRVSLSPLRDEPGLGMFVNTNKTGRDYTFPWLLAGVATNVQALIDWQTTYNPISAPVSDRGDNREERAAAVEPIWVYPIFRDPSRHNHRPISSGLLTDYFRALLK